MKLVLSSALILCSSIIFAQAKIWGTVSDSTGAPVPFIAMGLLSLPDSALVKGTMTDESGNYTMDVLKKGSYIMVISAVGFKEKLVNDVNIDSVTEKLVLNIQLTTASHALSEISVTALKRTVEFKNGNTIVNVEDSPLAQGNTVFDLLSKIPGVTINNNEISIQGKTGVIVMMDGRPQTLSGAPLVNLLKSMNADLVKSVEILKNPPVKYDAAGTSGMINIISKKTTSSGLTGTVFSSYSQGFYEQLLSGASLNYKTGKLVFYSAISGDYGHYRMQSHLKKGFTTDSTTTYLDNEMKMKLLQRNLNYKAGLDWQLTKTNGMGIKVEGNPGDDKVRTDGVNTVSGDNELGFDHLRSIITLPDKWNTTNFDFNFDHKLDTVGSAFTFVTDYSILQEDISSLNSNSFYDVNEISVLPYNNSRSDNKTNSGMYAGKADLTKVIDSSFSIEAGVKAVYSAISNNYLFERDYAGNGIYLTDSRLSNNFRYKEMTYAGYFNCIKSIRKLSMQLGVRLEKTLLTGENKSKNFALHKTYVNVFPNFSFEYKLRDQHDFQLNLLRRIDRPDFNALNPFILFADQYQYRQGNPFLLPAYVNRAELSYNHAGSFSTALAYSYTEHIIMFYASQHDSDKVTIQGIKNIKSSTRLEYSVYYQKSVTKKWDVSISGTFAGMNYTGDIEGIALKKNGINYFGNISNSILIGKKSKLEISGRYLGPNVFATVKVKPNYMASLALKIALCKEKLDLTIGMDDVFYSFKWRTMGDFDNQQWTYLEKGDSRRFRLALNYQFGKVKIAERKVNASNEEEKERFKH